MDVAEKLAGISRASRKLMTIGVSGSNGRNSISADRTDPDGAVRANSKMSSLMGRTKGPYNAEFPKGTIVKIGDRESLEAFQRIWRLHNELEDDQLEYAGLEARVLSVTFYHGGDELYRLIGVPGVWHEECLSGA